MIVLAALCLADLILAPATDPTARKMKGYGSRYAKEGLLPPSRFGARRVAHNIRHFLVYWRPPKKQWPKSVAAFLQADGNSLRENLFGHFGLAVAMCLIALFFGAPPLLVLIGASFLNIWHEYVAEGMYCDPSYVDLWLDQAGILAALLLFALAKRLRK